LENVALTIVLSKQKMLVTEIYNTLKQAQLVSTLEEYSTQWLNKHKTTASYLIHKKRELSISAKINCLKNIKKKIEEFENNEFVKDLNKENILSLNETLIFLKKSIKSQLQIENFI
jgi:hypothetical protein